MAVFPVPGLPVMKMLRAWPVVKSSERTSDISPSSGSR